MSRQKCRLATFTLELSAVAFVGHTQVTGLWLPSGWRRRCSPVCGSERQVYVHCAGFKDMLFLHSWSMCMSDLAASIVSRCVCAFSMSLSPSLPLSSLFLCFHHPPLPCFQHFSSSSSFLQSACVIISGYNKPCHIPALLTTHGLK